MEFVNSAEKALAKHSQLCGSPEDVHPVRVGILGTATIARKNVRGIKEVKGVSVDAIASRSMDKAKAFANEFGIGKAYDCYEKVIQDEDIDAVYVPLPTSLHLEWVLKAANAKKHILLEKPCALNSKDLFEMIKTCSENGVAFMDAVFFMHHDRLSNICEDLTSGKFGKDGPTHVGSSFCFPANEEFFTDNIRVKPDLDSLGCLGDLGWYNVRLALFAFGWEVPESASGSLNEQKEGVPIDLNGILTWNHTSGKSKSTNFHCSFRHASQQWAVISGTDATLMMDDFVIAKTNDNAIWYDTTNVEWSESDQGTSITSDRKAFKTSRCRQESRMWENFRNCCNASRNGASVGFWPGISLATQLCIDAILESAKNKDGQKVLVDPEKMMSQLKVLYP